MLLKPKKIAENIVFLRIFIKELQSFVNTKCRYCKYYIINRNDGKTFCNSSGHEKINEICTQDLYNTYFIYKPQ